MGETRHYDGLYRVQYPSERCSRDTNAEDTVKGKTVLELKKKMCYDSTYGTIIDTKKEQPQISSVACCLLSTGGKQTE